MADGARVPESPAAAARRAVTAFGAPGATVQARSDALHALVLLLRAPSDEAVAATVEAALDAGALPLLAATLRETAEASSSAAAAGEFVWKLCAYACGVVGELCRFVDDTRGLDAPAWAAAWRATVAPMAEALVARGAEDAMVADHACDTLTTMRVHGLLSDGDVAALAGRGAAEALKHPALSESRVKYHAARLMRTLLQPNKERPVQGRKRAAAAFQAAGGVEALCQTVEVQHGVSDTAAEMLGIMFLLLTEHSDGAALILLGAGAVGTVVQTLQSHLGTMDAARTACAVLDLLSTDHRAEVMDAISAADGWRVLVAALRQHGSDDMASAKFAIAVFATAAMRRPTCIAAAAAGAIPSITAAMRAHMGWANLQEHGLMALHHFAATGGGELAILLLAARASAAAVAAMARHSAPELQCAGYLVLESMCLLTDTQTDEAVVELQRRAACAAVTAGAPAAVLAALRANADNDRLRPLAPRVLVGLLQADNWPPDGVLLRETRAALVEQIAEHGCPVDTDREGARDGITITMALLSLADDSQPGHAFLPRLAEAMCVALGVAADMRAEGPDQGGLTVAYLVLKASQVIAKQAMMPGPAGAAFAAEAIAHGAVERLIASAAHSARRGGSEPAFGVRLPSSNALWAAGELAKRSPAAACISAACGAHTLVSACRSADAFAGVSASCTDAVAAMARRLCALAATHKTNGRCAVPDCPLLLMNRKRCCLRGCAAPDAPVKLCGSCRCAAYCSPLHQRQAWPTHKPVCAARKAAEMAAAALQAGEAGAAAQDNDA